MVWYCVCWGSDYWFVIVCAGTVINILVLCVFGQWLLVWYCVWLGSDYCFVIVYIVEVITVMVICVVGQ